MQPDQVPASLVKYRTMADLIKGAAEAQAAIGKKTLDLESARAAGRRVVEVPAADAPAEKWQEFYASCGRPEKPGDYKFTAPDGFSLNGGELDKVKDAFHKIGLSQTQFDAVFGAYVQHEMAAWNAAQDVIDQRATETQDRLGKEFGQLAGQKMTEVRALFARPEFTPLAEALKEAGLGTDYRVVRAMIDVAGALAEDTAAGSEQTVAGLDAQIKALQDSPAYMNGADPRHDAVMKQIRDLTTQKHRARGAKL